MRLTSLFEFLLGLFNLRVHSSRFAVVVGELSHQIFLLSKGRLHRGEIAHEAAGHEAAVHHSAGHVMSLQNGDRVEDGVVHFDHALCGLWDNRTTLHGSAPLFLGRAKLAVILSQRRLVL